MNDLSFQEVESILKRSCLNKIALSLEQADRYVDKKARNGLVIFYYKCELCAQYHATGSEPFSTSKIKII